jgi:hypothetical protein
MARAPGRSLIKRTLPIAAGSPSPLTAGFAMGGTAVIHGHKLDSCGRGVKSEGNRTGKVTAGRLSWDTHTHDWVR